MSSIWHTVKEILDRHRQVWRQSWRQRHQLKSPALLTHEAQFLPAALALQETPVSPLPRVIAWVIIAFVGIALCWAIISKIDVVAIAEGRIIPNDRSKNVQAFEISTVKKIHIVEGQAVQKGELLIELDNTNTNADLVRLQDNLFLANAKIERARSFLNALENVSEKTEIFHKLNFKGEEKDGRINDIQHLFDGQLEEYRAKQQRIQAEIARRTAESQTILESIHKFEQILPLAKRREADFKNLWLKNLIAEHEYLEKEQIRVEQQSDLASGRATLLQNKASLLEVQTQLKELHAQTRRIQLDVLQESLQEAANLTQDIKKAELRQRQTHLRAPVAGTVQQLAVHTIGAVVTPAQILMVVVPKDHPIEVEAFVLNKDIGFIQVGQTAHVKVETFQYTKYGLIPAVISSITQDAIADEKKGLIYSIRVKLLKEHIQVNGKSLRLSPGMAVVVEIKTDERRVIEYFLSPLMQHAHESLKER